MILCHYDVRGALRGIQCPHHHQQQARRNGHGNAVRQDMVRVGTQRLPEVEPCGVRETQALDPNSPPAGLVLRKRINLPAPGFPLYNGDAQDRFPGRL